MAFNAHSWTEISVDSDRLIAQAMDERRAYEPYCNCGAVDVEGASHLEWCESRGVPTGKLMDDRW